jgi:hypothetical protein
MDTKVQDHSWDRNEWNLDRSFMDLHVVMLCSHVNRWDVIMTHESKRLSRCALAIPFATVQSSKQQEITLHWLLLCASFCSHLLSIF